MDRADMKDQMAFKKFTAPLKLIAENTNFCLKTATEAFKYEKATINNLTSGDARSKYLELQVVKGIERSEGKALMLVCEPGKRRTYKLVIDGFSQCWESSEKAAPVAPDAEP